MSGLGGLALRVGRGPEAWGGSLEPAAWGLREGPRTPAFLPTPGGEGERWGSGSGPKSQTLRVVTPDPCERSQLPARNGGWEEGGQDGDRSSVHLSRYFCCYPCRLPELWVETGGSRSWPLGVRCPRPDLGREKQGLGMAFGLHAEKLHGLVPRMWVPGHGIVLGARARSRNRALALFLSGLVASRGWEERG